MVSKEDINLPDTKQVERSAPSTSISPNQSISAIIRALIREIISTHVDLILIACQQRAKFEGWLKLELAAALQKLSDIYDVVLEGSYPGRGRADICFTYHGFACYLEVNVTIIYLRIGFLEILKIAYRNTRHL